MKYYQELLEETGAKPEETIMIGNDVDEDMAAGQLGIATYLTTDHLINRNNKDINQYQHGTFEEMAQYLLNL